MTLQTLLLFILISAIAIATPGPTVLLALTNGSRFGLRTAYFGIAGALLSDFLLIAAVAVGLGALLAASEFWFSVIKWIGAAYLGYLGIKLLLSRQSAPAQADNLAPTSDNRRAVFLRCFLVALTNPKGLLFFSALLPQFINPGLPQLPQYLLIALAFGVLDVSLMLAYALAGARAAKVLQQRGMLWLNRACGGAFLGLAATLALYRKTTL